MKEWDLLLRQAEVLAVERRPEACLGCGFEHSCSLHGCAVIKMLVETVREDAAVIAVYEAVGPKLEDVKATIKALRKIDFSSIGESVASVTDWMLKTVNEAKDNVPLTLEELKQMDGEPVWVEMLVGNRPSHWAIIHGHLVHDGRFAEDSGGYGIAWLAYRRKPEGGKSNA